MNLSNYLKNIVKGIFILTIGSYVYAGEFGVSPMYVNFNAAPGIS